MDTNGGGDNQLAASNNTQTLSVTANTKSKHKPNIDGLAAVGLQVGDPDIISNGLVSVEDHQQMDNRYKEDQQHQDEEERHRTTSSSLPLCYDRVCDS